jgi:hypothetical protein
MSKLKPYKNAMSAKSPHVKFLTGILEWIEEWKFVGPKAELPCALGLKLTTSALLRLWNDLQSHHTFAFLLTSRLNQDCLENFFCIIRQSGGTRDNPNAEQFAQAFRQCAIKSPMIAPKGNCAFDSNIFLASLSDLTAHRTSTEIVTKSRDKPEKPEANDFAILPAQLDISDFVAKLNDDNIITYIAGYLIRKIAAVHKCNSETCCLQNLENDCRMFMSQSQTFMYHKALLRERGDFGCLKCPSELFVNFVSEMEIPFRRDVNAVSHLHSIIPRLISRGNVDIQLPCVQFGCFTDKTVVFYNSFVCCCKVFQS